MPLLLNVEPVRVDLVADVGEWVEIKSRLNAGERTKVKNAYGRLRMKFSDAGISGDAEAGTLLEAMEYAALEIGIVAWSYPQPVTPENIRALDPDDFDLLKARGNELWDSRSEESRKNSFASGAPLSQTAGDTPLSLVG